MQLAESLRNAAEIAPLKPMMRRRRIPRFKWTGRLRLGRARESVGEDLIEDSIAHPGWCVWPRGPLRTHPLTEPTASPPVMKRWLSRYTIAGGSVSMIEKAETSGHGIAAA